MTERDANGRFKKGHTGNPNGRPRKTVEEKYLTAIRKAVSVGDLEKIFDVGFARARAGDLGWARLICEYLIGKPTQYVDADIHTQGKLLIEVLGGYRNTNSD